MAIFNLGSINIDLVFEVPHIAAPGETVMSHRLSRGLGGKGANTSVALARGGAPVRHFGAIGPDGRDMVAMLERFGVDCAGVRELDGETGQAVIQVAEDGENAITLLKGANWQMPDSVVDDLVGAAGRGDWLVLQNETAHVPRAARRAREAGMRVAYAAAPFDATATVEVLECCDLLALNHIEAAQLSEATGREARSFGPDMVLVTHGAEGARLYRDGEEPMHQPAARADEVVDTTAAGDTFFGFFLARLDQGDDVKRALRLAAEASAIGVSRKGASASVPTLEEVLARLG
jgi:ribokinase